MRILFAILFSILVSCNLQGKKDVIISCNEKLVLKDSLVINWKLDSLGCTGFRNAKVLQVIFEKYWLYTKGVNEIKLILGKANEEYVNDRYYGFRYYSGNSCVNGKLPFQSEKCWFEVLISKKNEEETGYAKACQ